MLIVLVFKITVVFWQKDCKKKKWIWDVEDLIKTIQH